MEDITNRYAMQKGANWSTHTNEWEIRMFISLHILMDCLKYPRVRIYWSSFLGLNVFSQNMTVYRFFALRNNFHVVVTLNIENERSNDKFKKVRPMFDCVRKRCPQLQVEQNISIDEQIVPFTVKLNMKQYC